MPGKGLDDSVNLPSFDVTEASDTEVKPEPELQDGRIGAEDAQRILASLSAEDAAANKKREQDRRWRIHTDISTIVGYCINGKPELSDDLRSRLRRHLGAFVNVINGHGMLKDSAAKDRFNVLVQAANEETAAIRAASEPAQRKQW